MLLAMMDEAQQQAGVKGHLFEVGVHHGKSAVLLVDFARRGERVGVCDLFGSQDENVSRSGAGDREIFVANVARLAPGFASLDVFECRSDELVDRQVGAPVRMFHVDGGHLAEEALADLRFAAKVLHRDGIVVLDDPFDSSWPGVTEGLYQFLREDIAFVPFVMGFGKLVLCHEASRDYYAQFVAQHAWAYFSDSIFETKQAFVKGHPTTVFLISPALSIPGLDVKIASARARAARSRVLSTAAGFVHDAWERRRLWRSNRVRTSR